MSTFVLFWLKKQSFNLFVCPWNPWATFSFQSVHWLVGLMFLWSGVTVKRCQFHLDAVSFCMSCVRTAAAESRRLRVIRENIYFHTCLQLSLFFPSGCSCECHEHKHSRLMLEGVQSPRLLDPQTPRPTLLHKERSRGGSIVNTCTAMPDQGFSI